MDKNLENRIQLKVESIMQDNGQNAFFSFQSVLCFISLLYCAVTRIRCYLYKTGLLREKTLPCKVISIGNLAVGGTGKTPMTLYLAKLIKGLGYRTVIISRGYKGTAEKTGGIVSDGRQILMDADQSGDEPFMMAKKLKNIPVIVGQKRFEAGMLAMQKFNPDVIILDDAFQHIRLSRDVNLVLLDYGNPLGNGYTLPRGILREPINALLRGDAFIFTRSDRSDGSGRSDVSWPESLRDILSQKPVFRTIHVPYIYGVAAAGKEKKLIESDGDDKPEIFKKKRAFVFSGIANNKDFHKTVKGFGCLIAGFLEFSDHHTYSEEDLKTISQIALEAGAEIILTTEKDYVRIPESMSWPLDLFIISIRIAFSSQENAFDAFIKQQLTLDIHA